ncbi:MAG: IgGFc-binding protein, partial [Deltaproteobacteria bacterium]|nr:IgGFc-binding protein [Deltaproteobacteria bacterium]
MKRLWLALALPVGLAFLIPAACSAGAEGDPTGSSSSSAGTAGGGGIMDGCGDCMGNVYTPCNADGTPGTPVECVEPQVCSPGVGCTDCLAGETFCIGNEVWSCTAEGTAGSLVETCDVNAGFVCHEGECKTGCDIADDQPSNVGCEFWAVDLDQVDSFNDPASAPWGVALSNASQMTANVTIEYNDTAPGDPPSPTIQHQVSLLPGQLEQVILPTRELDCGPAPNDYFAPGTCLSSNAYRITSSSPIVVYQFNVFENAYSNDASLLLPTNALGQIYRVIGWSPGHPVPIQLMGNISDRSYVTIVGTEEGTTVTVRPSWRIKGNGNIPLTQPGETIQVDLGAFDVLNLETDDATFQEATQPLVADLTGTTVESNKPVAVFSGVESTSAPYHVDIPTYPGWDSEDTCCLDHLEEQMFPMESLGQKFIITRSPIRSTGSYHEPDVLRFVGAAETATVQTSLPAPLDNFTIQPGEVVDTWADKDVGLVVAAGGADRAAGDDEFLAKRFHGE